MESIKAGVAPAAIITMKVDPILALGSIVSDEMYDTAIPVLVLDRKDFQSIEKGQHVRIQPDGTVSISPASGDCDA